MRRSRTLGWALLILSGLVAGCGQSDRPSVPTGSTAVSSAPASGETPVVGSGRKQAKGSEAPGGVNTGIAP